MQEPGVHAVPFIADYFVEDLLAGAELNDAALIRFLQRQGLAIKRCRSRNVTYQLLAAHDVFIVGNFKRLKPEYRTYLAEKKKYLIFEHDFKICKNRQLRPCIGDDFRIAGRKLANLQFYRQARKVFFLTNLQAMVFYRNGGLENGATFHTSFFEGHELENIRQLGRTTGKKHHCIVVKDYKEYRTCRNYARRNGLPYTLVNRGSRQEFLQSIAEAENLVFHTNQVESFCRVVAEAQMLHCNILTDHKRYIGFYSEPYYVLWGDELATEINRQSEKGMALFHRVLMETLQS